MLQVTKILCAFEHAWRFVYRGDDDIVSTMRERMIFMPEAA